MSPNLAVVSPCVETSDAVACDASDECTIRALGLCNVHNVITDFPNRSCIFQDGCDERDSRVATRTRIARPLERVGARVPATHLEARRCSRPITASCAGPQTTHTAAIVAPSTSPREIEPPK